MAVKTERGEVIKSTEKQRHRREISRSKQNTSKKTSGRAGLLSKVYLHSALLMMASVDPSKNEVMLLTRKCDQVLISFDQLGRRLLDRVSGITLS